MNPFITYSLNATMRDSTLHVEGLAQITFGIPPPRNRAHMFGSWASETGGFSKDNELLVHLRFAVQYG
jgi:hypothetical protein